MHLTPTSEANGVAVLNSKIAYAEIKKQFLGLARHV